VSAWYLVDVPNGDGMRLEGLTDVQLLELMTRLVAELSRRQAGNDTVHWSDIERKIASGVTLPRKVRK
jgi:hypothetical protein